MAREVIPRARKIFRDERQDDPDLYSLELNEFGGEIREYKCRYGCSYGNTNMRLTTNHESKSLGARRKGKPQKECPPRP